MFQYANKGATLMCTGCPGVPGKLDAETARTVKSNTNTQATEADKKIAQPGFGMCLAIPTAPKKCSPNLGEWLNTKGNVIKKGKKALLFPNAIPCTSGPGMITMITSGSKVERVGATSEEEQEIDCDWQGDKHKHKGLEKKNFPNRENGVTIREKLTSWETLRPRNVFNTHHEKKKSVKIAYMAFFGQVNDSKPDRYPTQRHHVIPIQSIANVKDLENNLKLLGYNINDEHNGIRLPMYDEDIFWHDLPKHHNYNSFHSKYNDTVTLELKSYFKNKWKELCSQDIENELLNEIYEYVDALRDKMIRWDPKYYVFKDGGRRTYSFNNAGIKNVPSEDKARKFPHRFANQ